MASLMIGMLAETFVHPGVGQAISAIDLPVARERTTDYPFIPGSGIKGGFKTWAKEQAKEQLGAAVADRLFGKADNAGTILLSDARLLLLPVRSLDTAYVWLTCPILLERLRRDAERSGVGGFAACAAKVDTGKYIGKARPQMLTLEERELGHTDSLPAGLVEALARLAPAVGGRMADQIAIVADDDFAWFAKYALPVAARNHLDDKTKTSTNLWYEETLPPDTVMYCLVADRGATQDGTAQIKSTVQGGHGCNYGQFGGNETLGQGWFQLTVV
jgi:CRISPR-associated protein Cmr4